MHEIAAQTEATAGKSSALKREMFVRRIHLALEAQRAQLAKTQVAFGAR